MYIRYTAEINRLVYSPLNIVLEDTNGGFYLLAFQSSSTYASPEDTSSSGTIVYRGQHDDSDSPRTPKSRLGLQERSSSAAPEDSEVNLSEVGILLINIAIFVHIMVRL